MSAIAPSGGSLFTSLTPSGNHTENANRVVFVIMLISSVAFYAMAFRVPVVSSSRVREGASF